MVTHYCHGYCQVPSVFLSNSLAQLEMAWYMNPKGRTGQLFPTQIYLYFSLFLWSGRFIRLKTVKTQKAQVIQKSQIHFKQFQYQVPRLQLTQKAKLICMQQTDIMLPVCCVLLGCYYNTNQTVPFIINHQCL